MDSRSHGILDYLSVGFLVILPRALRWNRKVTNVLTGAAISTLAYSLLTKYEYGVFRIIPFRVHLGLDALSGAFFCIAPIFFRKHSPVIQAAMVGIGMFEIAASIATEDDTEPQEPFKFEQYQGKLKDYSPI